MAVIEVSNNNLTMRRKTMQDVVTMIDGQPTLVRAEMNGNEIYDMMHCPDGKFVTLVRADDPLNRETIVRSSHPVRLNANDRIELLNQVRLGG